MVAVPDVGEHLGDPEICRRKGYMRKNTSKKLICLALSLLMLVSILPLTVMAEETETSGGKSTLQEISDSLNSISYAEYKEIYEGVERGKRTVTIDGADYQRDETDAEVEIDGDALKIGDSGKVTWNVNVPDEGMYAIRIEYTSESDKTNSVERMLYINGAIPFKEARFILLKKVWVNEYAEDGRFALDAAGNELRPTATVISEWETSDFTDSNGYYSNPFEFYFKKGENTIALEGVREPLSVKSITLYPYEDKLSYEEYLNKNNGSAGSDKIYLNAETPASTSDYTIYPIYDRKSAFTEPQSASQIRLNTIGGDKWETAGQYIEYEFEIKEAGYYNIITRFRQNTLQGLYTSRKIYIDDEVPFEEANNAKFPFSSDWQIAPLNNGTDNFKFYLEAGKHTLKFEVAFGEMGDIVRRVSAIMNSINSDYLEIMKLTGSSPDAYRDYGFGRVLPNVVRDLLVQAVNLSEVIDYIEGMADVKSENSATLSEIERLLRKMGTNESEIAKNLSDLKSNVGTLGEWINTVNSQPLEFDYILIQSEDETLPKAEAGFFEGAWYEIKQFFASFFTDYNTLGTGDEAKNERNVEVWVTNGRDQAQIMRTLMDNNFAPEYKIDANLKLVASGTLLPSVLAGVGPDVSIAGASVDPITYAIRSAVVPINPGAYEDATDADEETKAFNAERREIFANYDEVTERFTEAAMIPLTLYGKTYGLPDTQKWPMMFYRTDILNDLGLEVPKTWDDLLAMIPVLQFNNMEIGLNKDYKMFLYQMGEELWADDGMRINLDSNLSLEAFETMCNMYTQYSLSTDYDFANRFRTGEMPIAIQEYTQYNNIIIFATEIAGLWEFGPVPGTLRDDGTIDNTAISTTEAVIMMSGVDDVDAAWKFMCWYTDKQFQVDYSNELVAILGPAAKNATANMAALEELPWTSREYSQLMKQMSNTTSIVKYPGDYILDRYTNFAFLAAYNEGADPADALLDYINAINKEISRKRVEFNLETLEIGQTLASKRLGQASEAIGNLDAETASANASSLEKASAAIANSDIEELKAAAASLDTSNEALSEIAGYITDAANALQSYKK